ncbi:MAG: protease inhibitor I42 family protein [Bacteroidales bacterium]|nr:protease inhibitor I42 family protein [Bacteroidales bacterium]
MKKLIYISMLLLIMTGCASQKKMVAVNKETNDITLKVGQSCEIEFRTNASTGFWWQLTNSNDITVVDSIGKRYESDAPKGMVGASSDLFWKFKAKEKGTQTLHFVYARDKVDEAIKTRDVTITVK